MTTESMSHVALLRSLVKGDAGVLARALSDPTTDVAGFLRFAHAHQLGAYAYWTLQRLGLARALPPALLAATKASSLAERTRCERLVRQLHDLGELFEAGGAKVMFIKGPLLAQRFYGSVEARGFSDLDVLISRPGDLDRVEALLLETGFEPEFRVLLSRRLSRYFSHHFEYRREGLPLDVHWVLQRHFTFEIDYRRIWQTATHVTLEGRTYEATSDEYELVLQLVGIVTDLQVGKLVLRSFVDVFQILWTVEGTIDWDEFFSWRARERILRPSLYVLALTLEVLECSETLPGLAAALHARRHLLPPTTLGRRAILESRPLAFRQKLLALRLYEAPLAALLAWWVLSLPFRIAVYGVWRRPIRRET